MTPDEELKQLRSENRQLHRQNNTYVHALHELAGAVSTLTSERQLSMYMTQRALALVSRYEQALRRTGETAESVLAEEHAQVRQWLDDAEEGLNQIRGRISGAKS